MGTINAQAGDFCLCLCLGAALSFMALFATLWLAFALVLPFVFYTYLALFMLYNHPVLLMGCIFLYIDEDMLFYICIYVCIFAPCALLYELPKKCGFVLSGNEGIK